ncbi:MAG: hypothetical protein ACLUWN_02665 [Clostridia bacterium]
MDLKPVYSNVKSFYGKARIIRENGVIKLLSYDTVIAEIKDNKVHINGFYSQTSTRHLKEFLQQYGFKIGTKAQLEKMYC